MNGLIDENGVSIWDADCSYDPDETLENQSMVMVYRGRKQFFWTYVTVVEALEIGMDKFLKKSIPTESVSTEAKEELEIFFKHWLTLMQNGGNIYSLGEEDENLHS